MAGLAMVCFSVPAFADARWPDLTQPPAAQGGGEGDAALIIAIERYASAPAIPGAVKNATDWYRYLTDARWLPAESIRMLQDDDATAETMRARAAEVAALVKPGGTAWLVFIGHGAPARDGKDGLLVGYDAQQKIDSLFARGVTQTEMLGLLGRGKQARTVAVVDACFSGVTPSGSLVPGAQPFVAVEASSLPPSVVVLSAGASDEYAGPLPGAARPAFSYLLLGALRGWGDANGDGQVSAVEAGGYASRVLATLLTDRKQTPGVRGAGAGEPLCRRARERGPDLTALAMPAPDQPPRDPGAAPPVEGPPAVGADPGANTTNADFVSANASGRWDIYIDDEVVCTTPCRRPVDPMRPVLLRAREAGFMTAADKIMLSDLGPHAAAGPVQVRAHATSRGKLATGITFASLGGMGVLTGATFAGIGCGDDRRPEFCTPGLIALGSGAVVAAGAVWLILDAMPRAEVLPVQSPPRITVGPGVIAGTF